MVIEATKNMNIDAMKLKAQVLRLLSDDEEEKSYKVQFNDGKSSSVEVLEVKNKFLADSLSASIENNEKKIVEEITGKSQENIKS